MIKLLQDILYLNDVINLFSKPQVLSKIQHPFSTQLNKGLSKL